MVTSNPRKSHTKHSKSLEERYDEIVVMVCEGLKNKEIADRMGYSHKTIASHMSIVYAIHGVESRLQLAVKFARENRSHV